MAKSTKIIAALGVAAGLGVAAMPLATYAADVKDVTDNITVKVDETCSFKAETARTHVATQDDVTNGKAENEGDTVIDSYGSDYSGQALPDAVVDLNGAAAGNDATHTFKVACNNANGYTVKATATGLTGEGLTAPNNKINYMTTSVYNAAVTKVGTANAEEDGGWNASLAASGTIGTDDYVIADAVSESGDTIVTKATAAPSAGTDFTVTYRAFTGKSTKAGTYTGTVVYNLAATPSA